MSASPGRDGARWCSMAPSTRKRFEPMPTAAASPSPNVLEVTVSELSGALKRTLEDAYDHVRVRGELGKVSRHSNGHVYFDLKDTKSCIAGVMWRTTAVRSKVPLELGMEVVVTGRITTYPGRSQYQLIADSIAPAGLGALMAQMEERKQRLAAEGLFDPARKQLLPSLPEVIGVVTSPTGAVIRDILHRLADRFPRHVLVWPVRVQGDGSAEEVAAAIRGFNALAPGGRTARPDLLIVARGGGSVEDLWSFNDEAVVRAAAESFIPLIAAVGHETDTTLIDYAADKRAPTPTAAAEMAVPVRAELIVQVEGLARRTWSCWARRQDHRRTELRGLVRALPSADRLLGEPRQQLDAAGAALLRALKASAGAHRAALVRAETRLAVQSPRAQVGRARHQVETLEARGRRAVAVLQERRRDRFSALGDRLTTGARADRAAHAAKLARDRERIASLAERAERAIWAGVDRRDGALARAADLLSAYSYHGVLARGFALVRDAAGAPLRTAAAVGPGAMLDIEFADGRIAAATTGAIRTPAPEPSPRLRRARRAPADPAQGKLFG